MARRFGWAAQGQRRRMSVPFGHWDTKTPIAGASFLAYVEQVLAPTLSPGDMVVLDNVALHKVIGVAEAKGASVLYLSTYSPDFNPIEKLFSKFKSVLRRIAARSVDALEAAVGDALRSVTPDQCRNYLAACGNDGF